VEDGAGRRFGRQFPWIEGIHTRAVSGETGQHARDRGMACTKRFNWARQTINGIQLLTGLRLRFNPLSLPVLVLALVCGCGTSGNAASQSSTHGERSPTPGSTQSFDTQPPAESTLPPPETGFTAPPKEPDSLDHHPETRTTAPPRRAMKKFSIKFASPGGTVRGRKTAPQDITLTNPYPYAETVEIIISPPPWRVINNNCATIGAGGRCSFTAIYTGSESDPASLTKVAARITSVCTDKLKPPCSSLPSDAQPTPTDPILAVWERELAEVVSPHDHVPPTTSSVQHPPSVTPSPPSQQSDAPTR
jgi:hypothetical protein